MFLIAVVDMDLMRNSSRYKTADIDSRIRSHFHSLSPDTYSFFLSFFLHFFPSFSLPLFISFFLSFFLYFFLYIFSFPFSFSFSLFPLFFCFAVVLLRFLSLTLFLFVASASNLTLAIFDLDDMLNSIRFHSTAIQYRFENRSILFVLVCYHHFPPPFNQLSSKFSFLGLRIRIWTGRHKRRRQLSMDGMVKKSKLNDLRNEFPRQHCQLK